MTAITYCGGCLRQEEIAALEARAEFLRGQAADLVAALAESKAHLKAWQRAEDVVCEITPTGREALARYKEG